MSKQSLLLVDGDTRSLRVLEVSLRKAGFMVTAAASVQDALDKLELHVPDLIISETTFPDGDGFELRRRVRAMPEWAEIPFIFLTAEAAIENKIRGLELGVDDYLTKPIYIKEIVTRINILLQKRQRVRFEERRDGRTRFAGRVQDMPVVDVIQTIEISRKSGVIQFVGERGRQAAIYFRDGRVIDAEAGSLQGEDAVYRLLTWGEGEFEVVFRTVRRREVISMSSQALLMEGMRRLDEWSRLFEQLPPLTHRFEVDTVELAARLGDVPDDNNRILRLVDGKRTLLEVIDASDVGDLECLQAISRLYFEELLIDLDHGLDHNRTPRRDTGKAMPLVEIDGPSPVTDEGSGPIAAATEPAAAGEVGAASATGPAAEAADAPVVAPGPAAEVTPVTASDASEEAAAVALRAASDASEEATAAALEAASEPPLDPEAAIDEVGPLMGGYRPSSLRLIDEAVAAAQAVEPSLYDDSVSLFDDSAETQQPSASHGSNGVSRHAVAVEPASAEADDSGASTRAETDPGNRREDSGLRMIGSLGRDRAEASGELAPLGTSRPRRSETARELVTILPRRITREMPMLTPELADSLPTPTPTSPVLAPRSVSAAEAEPTLRVAKPGSGVRAPSRSQRLLRIVSSVQGSGPGVGAVLLILLAVVLAGTAVLLRLRRHAPSAQSVESVHSATGVPGSAAQVPGATDVTSTLQSGAFTVPSSASSDVAGAVTGLPETNSAARVPGAAEEATAGTQPPNGATGGREAGAAGAPDAPSGAAGGRESGGVSGADGRSGSAGGAGGATGVPSGSAGGAGGATGVPSGSAGGAGGATAVPAGTASGRESGAVAGADGRAAGGSRGAMDAPGGARGTTDAPSGTAGGRERGAASGANARSEAGDARGASTTPGAKAAADASSGKLAAGTDAKAPSASAGSASAGSAGAGASAPGAAAGSARTAGAPARREPAADRATEAKALCDQASNALDEGDAARAYELAGASLKLRKTARGYMLRARAEQRLDRVDDALASLDLATEIAPAMGAVWEQRGRILWAARRHDEARAAFSRFLDLDPKSPRAAEVSRLLNEPR